MSGPRIVAGTDRDGFRIVRVEHGKDVKYVLELPDGCDSLGVERWRDAEVNGKPAKVLFAYVIRQTLEQES